MTNQKRGPTDPASAKQLTNSGAKEKHQLNPSGPSNRQEAPATISLHVGTGKKMARTFSLSIIGLA